MSCILEIISLVMCLDQRYDYLITIINKIFQTLNFEFVFFRSFCLCLCAISSVSFIYFLLLKFFSFQKTRGWKTFLIVPELNRELVVWTGKRDLFDQLRELEAKMADLYKNLDADTRGNSEMKNILEPTLKSIRVFFKEFFIK